MERMARKESLAKLAMRRKGSTASGVAGDTSPGTALTKTQGVYARRQAQDSGAYFRMEGKATVAKVPKVGRGCGNLVAKVRRARAGERARERDKEARTKPTKFSGFALAVR